MVSSHIYVRGRVFRLRTRIPAVLSGRVGRQEISRSLETGDRTVARYRGARLAASLFSILTRIRNEPSMPRVAIDQLVKGWLQRKLDDDLTQRGEPYPWMAELADELGFAPGLYHAGAIAGSAHDELERLLQMSQEQDFPAMVKHVAGDIAELGVVSERGSAAYLKLAHALCSAVVTLKETQVARSEGRMVWRADLDLSEFSGEEVEVGEHRHLQATPTLPSPAASATLSSHIAAQQQVNPPAAVAVATKAITLGEAVDQYLLEQQTRPLLSLKRRNAVSTALELLKEVVGESAPIDTILPPQLGKYRQVAIALPKNRRKVVKQVGYEEAIRLASNGSLPLLDDQTVKGKYITPMKQFFRWCRSNGLVDVDPSLGIDHLAAKKQERVRNPFDESELQTIFRSPLYTGCLSASRVSEPGSHRVRDHRFWVPLIALFSGARINEICQLRLDQVIEQDGVWCFNITNEKGGRLKTRASRRKTPIHPELVRLGLVNYVRELQTAEEEVLWPDLRQGSTEYISAGASKFFNRYFDKVLGCDHRRERLLCFHSFRHNATDALRDAGVAPDVRDALFGHEGKTVESRSYGVGYGLPRLAEELAKLIYPVDLSHLYAI